jgi:nucleotide-binding universal stress UspA family protein
MNRIKRILAPTDLSELSQVGVRYALNLAKAFGAEVTAYYVVTAHDLMRHGDEIREAAGGPLCPSAPILQRHQFALARFLNDHFSDLTPWVRVREKVEPGKPDENIVERAKTEGSDLIVICTHGRSGLSHLVVGSVTEKVVRHAPARFYRSIRSHGRRKQRWPLPLRRGRAARVRFGREEKQSI